MNWKDEVRAAFAPQGIDDDVAEELAQHAALACESAFADTGDHAEAERRTRLLIATWAESGTLATRRRGRASEDVLAPHPERTSRFAGLSREVRHACRSLLRQPGYSAVAILTIALGVAATTALFSLAYGVLLKPLPWAHADRLVRLYETRQGATSRLGPIMTSAPYVAWRERPSTIDGLAGWHPERVALDTGTGVSHVRIAAATASLFPVLGVPPLLGTPYAERDESAQETPPVVLSFALWQERFGGDRNALGRTIRLDTKPYRIVGVMPPSFTFPDADTQAWIPLQIRFVRNGLSIFAAIARLKPGVTPAQAAAEATARARGGPDPGVVLMAVFGSRAPATISVVPLLEAQTGAVRPAILVFLAAVGLLLVTAVANVASIQLARGTARRREMAIRVALGAGGARLVRHTLVENAVLGLAAGAVGLVLVALLHGVLPSLLPASFPRVHDVRVDALVAVFAFAVSLVASVLCGMLPALQARRVNVVESLADDGQAPTGVGRRLRSSRARALIIMGQLAIASVLLLGASLLTRSFVAMLTADRGYDPANVLTATLGFPEHYDADRLGADTDALLARLKTVPAFTHAAVTSSLPLMSAEVLASFPVRNGRTGAVVQAQAANRFVSPEYFATLGVHIVAGRRFGAQDTRTSKPVVMVNRAFARKYLGTDPVGLKLWDDTPERRSPEVIGVIEDVRHRSVTDMPAPEIYTPVAQIGAGEVSILAVKTTGHPAAYAQTLRALVREVDPAIDVDLVTPMETLLMTSLAQPRLYSLLAVALAALALIVAVVGLFGVLGYAVAQRTREIGVRTALGASPSDIAVLVLRQGLAMAGGGLLVGLLVAFSAARSLASLLFGVTAYDPVSYLVVPLALLGAAGVACVIPARRAARVNPLTALRQ